MKKWKRANKAFKVVSVIAFILFIVSLVAVFIVLPFITVPEWFSIALAVEGAVSVLVYFVAYRGMEWTEAEYKRHKYLARRK